MIDLIGWALIHSTWQGGVIAAVLAVLLSGTRRAPSSVRYLLSAGALGLMVVLPSWTAWHRQADDVPQRVATSFVESSQSFVSTAGPSVDGSRRALTPATPAASPDVPTASPRRPSLVDQPTAVALRLALRRWLDVMLPWLVAAWSIGLALLSVRLLGGVRRTLRLAHDATQPAREQVRAVVDQLATRLGVRGAVDIVEAARGRVPLVIGWLRPVIVLPISVLSGLPPQQMEMLLAHELAHIRRYDYLANLLQTVVETLLFYHPATWWISARIREERENCCDDLAVAVCGGDPAGYSSALLALEEWRDAGVGLASAATGGSLLRRVVRLLRGDTGRVDLGPSWLAGVLTVLAALLTAGESVGIAAQPSVVVPASMSAIGSDIAPRNRARLADTAMARPDTIITVIGDGSLDERWRRGEAQVRALRSSRQNRAVRSNRVLQYWVGYVVRGNPDKRGWYYFDRDVPVISTGGTFSGHINFGGDAPEGLIFRGVPLSPLFGDHAPRDIAIFLGFDDDGSAAPRLARTHAASFALPVHFDREPVVWLGSADDAESVDHLARLWTTAQPRGLRRDMVSLVSLHSDSRVVVPLLVRWLEDASADEDTRREAAEGLGEHPERAAIAALARVVRSDRQRSVREEAVEAFAHMKYEGAADTLVSFVRTVRDTDLREKAVESLGHRTEPAVIAVLRRLVDSDDSMDMREKAVEALADMEDDLGIPTVIELAQQHALSRIRRKAVEAIADMRATDRSLEVLQRVLRTDTDESVREAAVEAIANVDDSRSLGILQELIERAGDERVQVKAVEALANLQPAEEAIDALARIARTHGSHEVRKKAAESLGNFDTVRAVDALEQIVNGSGDTEVQRAAAEALGSAQPQGRALAALIRIARQHPDADVQKRAVESLQNFGDNDQGVQALVEIANRHPNRDVQRTAVETLGGVEHESAIVALESLARSASTEDLRIKAIESYASAAHGTRAVTFLRSIIDGDKSTEVRMQALESLGDLDDDAGVKAIREIARSTSDSRIRDRALELLEKN